MHKNKQIWYYCILFCLGIAYVIYNQIELKKIKSKTQIKTEAIVASVNQFEEVREFFKNYSTATLTENPLNKSSITFISLLSDNLFVHCELPTYSKISGNIVFHGEPKISKNKLVFGKHSINSEVVE